MPKLEVMAIAGNDINEIMDKMKEQLTEKFAGIDRDKLEELIKKDPRAARLAKVGRDPKSSFLELMTAVVEQMREALEKVYQSHITEVSAQKPEDFRVNLGKLFGFEVYRTSYETLHSILEGYKETTAKEGKEPELLHALLKLGQLWTSIALGKFDPDDLDIAEHATFLGQMRGIGTAFSIIGSKLDAQHRTMAPEGKAN